MFTLGIETSCDETSCAVLEGKNRILSNIVSSSLFRHKAFGGVVPEIASRHSLEQIDFVFQQALKQARIKPSDIDLVATTYGPGLIGSLLVGVSFAKALSYRLKIPLVGVNHLEAHLVCNFIGRREPRKYIGLVVSGGHTSLTYHLNRKITVLGSTVDDAVGEAFDKVAKILGLGYPGGPIIEKWAGKGNPDAIPFTKPKQKNPYDFSFSGIKTAVLYFVEKHRGGGRKKALPGRNAGKGKKLTPHSISGKPLRDSLVQDIAASFQKSVIRWLVEKTIRSAQDKRVKHIVVGGGVSANSLLRESLIKEAGKDGFTVYFPPLSLTIDNAAMIARRGIELYQQGVRSSITLTGMPNLGIGV